MRTLTEQVKSSDSVPAPAGLRQRVLRGIEFKPVKSRRFRLRWYEVAGVGAVAVLLFALVVPTMNSARESARKSAAAENMRPLGDEMSLREAPAAAVPQATAKMRVTREGKAYGINLTPKPADSDVSAPSGSMMVIIKTADLNIRVKDFQESYDRAVEIAKSAGGYVTDSSASTEGKDPTDGSLTIRVPVYAFERTLKRLGELGTVKSRSINGEDVTGEVVDLDARLRNKRAEERQYLDIMNRAKRVPDIVTVTQELSRVRGEIEEMQGRLKYLKASAAMSTINVEIGETVKKPVPVSSIGGALRNALKSFAGTLNGLATVLVWLAVYSPFWAIPLAVAFYLRRRNTAAVEEQGS